MGYKFTNDYSELCDERILEALSQNLGEQNVAYGLDRHSLNAARLIKSKFNAPNAEVHFLAGGTQTNMTFISYVLRPYEGVIACKSGHINIHETAAVEGSGHKIFTCEGKNGKLYPEDIEYALKICNNVHVVKLRMVYISNSTEIGTIYSKKELIDLKEACLRNNLYLFIDGARLASALTCDKNDLSPEDIGPLCDAFYVGGTKNGLLYGEALVIVNPQLQKDFRYQIKNKGAMLAKGFAVGIQFERAFQDDLYFELAEYPNILATKLRNYFISRGYKIIDCPTNQVFITLRKELAAAAIEQFGCELWEELENEITIRFVTSFTTNESNIDEVINWFEERDY